VDKYDAALDDEHTRAVQQVLSNIVRHVYSFADAKYQVRVWVDGEGPEVDSYSESVCGLFDDSNVTQFLDGERLEFGYSDEMVRRLRSFVGTLNDFHARLKESKGTRWPGWLPDSEIVAEAGWQTVTQSASEFLDSAVVWFERYGLDALMLEWSWRGKTFGNA
jgi:hypothetical protein